MAAAIVAAIQAEDETVNGAATVSAFDSPPLQLNPPAVVVSRPSEVLYGTGGFGVDVATLPVICIGPQTGEDMVNALLGLVRDALKADPRLGGLVAIAHAPSERNWRAVRIGGADMLAADLTVEIQM